VNVPAAGNYEVALHYTCGEARPLMLSVNGGTGIEMTGFNSGGWYNVSERRFLLALQAGDNTIRIYHDTAWTPDIDRIVIWSFGDATITPTPTPTTSTPTIPPTVANRYFLPYIAILYSGEPITMSATALVVIVQDSAGVRQNNVTVALSRCMDEPPNESGCAEWDDATTLTTQTRFNETGIAAMIVDSFGWYRVTVGNDTRTFWIANGTDYHNEVFTFGARVLAARQSSVGANWLMLGALIAFVAVVLVVLHRARVG
jgi:hypothetical protein